MNERIRELAVQAGIKITPLIVDGDEYDYEEVDMDGYDDLKKFAELIVRECANIAFEEWQHNGGSASGESAILKYFGVEE
jgi:hypothetical protein